MARTAQLFKKKDFIEIKQSLNNKLQAKTNIIRKERLNINLSYVLKATKKMRNEIGAIIQYTKEIEQENNAISYQVKEAQKKAKRL